jgi:uncharacterized protein
MMHVVLYVAGFLFLGLLAGVFSGLLGLGGGLLLVPVLVFIVGLTQHQAQGTTLALMVPPIGLLAAWAYWKQGYVDVKIAALICIGFFFGGLWGARIAGSIEAVMLKRLFGMALLIIALRMILSK